MSNFDAIGHYIRNGYDEQRAGYFLFFSFFSPSLVFLPFFFFFVSFFNSLFRTFSNWCGDGNNGGCDPLTTCTLSWGTILFSSSFSFLLLFLSFSILFTFFYLFSNWRYRSKEMWLVPWWIQARNWWDSLLTLVISFCLCMPLFISFSAEKWVWLLFYLCTNCTNRKYKLIYLFKYI